MLLKHMVTLWYDYTSKLRNASKTVENKTEFYSMFPKNYFETHDESSLILYF